MKKKGKMDQSTIKRLGLDVEIKEDPHAESIGQSSPNQKEIAAIKQRHAEAKKKMLEDEKRNE